LAKTDLFWIMLKAKWKSDTADVRVADMWVAELRHPATIGAVFTP
jgi:hypothetical protein